MIPNHIMIGDSSSHLNRYLSENNYSKICILVDENTHSNCLKKIEGDINFDYDIFKIDSGEEEKNLATCSKVWNFLTENLYDRKSLIINLGGGVICDMGGFVASTFKRGVDFINIPTTLLAQVDASVGGKLGIDFNSYKNQIGIFKIPNLIIVDTKFLSSLSERELRSGYAEVIKHCLINDATKFKEITKINWKDNNWEEIVRHSILIKSEVVENDLNEEGLRKILNFGHTTGHAIETTYLEKKNKFFHGEAIAIGMICESYISFHKKMLSENELNTISGYILSVFKSNKIEYHEEILKNAKHDKKNFNKKIMISLLEEVGKCNFDFEVSEDEIKKSIEYYNKLIS